MTESRYEQKLFHYETGAPLTPHPDIMSGDNLSWEMLPDNTAVICQLITNDGKNMKKNGELGNEIIEARIMDQRCFKTDILYAVEYMKFGLKTVGTTRASLINSPLPNDFKPE
tara:strand:- start:466 stop:804 length:339 start_codon:yes stop_codon:yes gene_type:complete